MIYNLFVDYKKLPEPLEQEELYDYFERLKMGDKAAREIIIEHNIRLVINRVKIVFNNTGYEEKELIAVGTIGLIKSVDTFDMSRGIKFNTYAIKCIDNEIRMFLRNGKKHKNIDSLDTVLNVDRNGKELKIEDILCDENADFVSEYEKEVLYDIVDRIVENLPARDKKIIMLYFGFMDDKPLSQQQIADKLGVSQSYISRLLKQILKRIKLRLKSEWIIEESSNSKKVKKNIKR